MSKKRIHGLFFYIFTLVICVFQISCTIGGADNTNTVDTVSLGSVATIPILSGTTAITTMVVDNNVNANLDLISAIVLKDGKAIDQVEANDLIDTSFCNHLAAYSSCTVAVSPPKTSGSFILKLTFANNNGKRYIGTQLISYSSEVKQENGFVYFAPEQLPVSEGKHTLSIPIILENNYSKLSVATASFSDSQANIKCPGNKYTVGTMCTVFVTYSNSQNLVNQSPQLLISGKVMTKNATVKPNSMGVNDIIIRLSLTKNGAANLVVSAPNIQITAGLNTTVTILNNGVSTATGISYNGLTPISATTSGATCGTSLAAGSSCTFNVSVSSTTTNSGFGSVIILYSNGINQTKSLSFNVYYSPATTTPSLTLSTNGWLVGTLVNSVNYQGINVVNTGTAILNNLQFGSVSNQVSGMSYGGNGQSCVNGMSLSPGSSCIMVVKYAPATAVTIRSLNVAAAANYTSQSGSTLNYVNGTTLQYSSHTTAAGTFVAAGDYGALTSSTTTPAGTWTVKNNTPFIANGTSISRMASSTNLQVIGIGAGADTGTIYQAPKGMIWQSASGGTNAPPIGGGASAITGITYDSTNGYLVTNAAGAGNLYSISESAITGVAPSWTLFAGAFPRQPFNLFNFGTNLVYLAPLNNTGSNNQLSVSTNPTLSWATPNPTGSGRTYITATNDGNNYCIFSSTRFVSCANASGFTVASTWTQNSTAIFTTGTLNAVANNNTTSYAAALSVSPFVVFLSSPSNPATAGTWSSALTPPSVALRWITYGGGQYVGVSAATPGLIWTSPTGNVWTQRTSGTANNPVNQPYGFVYYDGSNYWAAGVFVLKVSPDGVNWSNAGISDLTYTYIESGVNYLAAGTAGAIESSNDLITWSDQNAPTTNKLNAIKCFNSNNCYAAGESGTLLFSNDGAGASWGSQTTGTTKGLKGIACGYSNCVVVGESGTILVESTGSNSWIAQISGTTQNLNSVTFNNAQNLYIAVGNTGAILTSSDGVTWSSRTSGTANNLNSVACAYSNIGCMAVGASGTVLTSLTGDFWSSGATATATSNEVTFDNGYWILAQAAGVKYSLDNSTLAWSTVSTGISQIAVMNMNAILAY